VDAFSYLSVLLSIILGLGLTQVLTAAGGLIRHRERVRGDWLPLLWAALLLIIYVQVWWAMFGLRFQREWTFVGFLAVLALPSALYVMAAVVLPAEIPAEGVDMRAYYARHHRWLFGCLLAVLVISVVKDVVVSGQLPSAVNLSFHAALAASCIAALLLPRRRVQEAIGIVCVLVMATYIGLLFARLR
jgi:hypothetical protein